MQDLNHVFEVLKAQGLNPEFVEVDEHGFSRVIKFDCLGITYFIEWYSNVAYLSIGSRHASYIPFHKVRPDSCWPRYCTGLVFAHETGCETHVATKLLDWQEGK